jgi:carboxypeptidase family protein
MRRSYAFDENNPWPSRRSRWASAVVLGCLLATIMPAPALAQSDTGGYGRIAGTARDASGLVLPGASVSARNLRTGETADTTSNAQGHYMIAGLRPSSYAVTARLTGFAPVEFRRSSSWPARSSASTSASPPRSRAKTSR